ncbi:MAG: DUF4920 domain-containing protein [Balneolales bacterium]|nr:DUF4920 domain-containing protein [Balneolales bacterium]
MKLNRVYPVIIFLLASYVTLACSSESAQEKEDSHNESVFFGDSFEAVSFTSIDEVIPVVTAEESGMYTVKGEVVQVCQSKGCWLTLFAEDGTQVRVTFKDYAFFVPKDIAGREVVMHGIAWVDEVSVASLRHYAMDAGDTEEEIAAINEPKRSYYFEATGVMLL